MKLAHPKMSLKDKHRFYLEQMKLVDVENNLIKDHIRWMSSESDQIKSRTFHKHINNQKEKLRNGRVLREAYRLKVRRYKETIKNENRHNNNGIDSLI